MSPKLAERLREELVDSTRQLLQGKTHVGIVLSGGVDTGAVLAACKEARHLDSSLPQVTCAVSVFATPTAPDREFSRVLAKLHDLDHLEVETTSRDLVQDCLQPTISALASFDPMQIRNSLVVCKALESAKRKFPHVELWLTGDASDELLGGYSFTWGSEDPEWSGKRDDMSHTMMFSSDALAERLHMQVKSPFRGEVFVQFVRDHCNKAACVAERSLITHTNDLPTTILTGKVVLREAFDEKENPSTWRRKDPIEVGSGATELSQVGFFQLEASRTERIVQAAKEMNIILREHEVEQLVYFETFHAIVKDLPNVPRREQGVYCVACRYELYHPEADFCRSKCYAHYSLKLTHSA